MRGVSKWQEIKFFFFFLLLFFCSVFPKHTQAKKLFLPNSFIRCLGLERNCLPCCTSYPTPRLKVAKAG